ncbi:MAG: hypothetical protein RMK15_06320, partial [Chloroflexota bacterium]|nr:hypothetical protein [Dehalococcoidia bacterium]MDW8046881.1 hypothetical protein [Chloroflexota bacterium]
MGFYHGRGSEPPPGSWRETFAIIGIVFRTLALPLAILFGTIGGLFLLFWLFAISPLAALGAVILGLGGLAARALWEWRH